MQDLESHEPQKRLIIGTVTADNPYDVILFDWVPEKLYRYLVLNFKNIEEILLHNIEHPTNAKKYGVSFTGFYSSYEYKDSIPSADIKKILLEKTTPMTQSEYNKLVANNPFFQVTIRVCFSLVKLFQENLEEAAYECVANAETLPYIRMAEEHLKKIKELWEN